MKRFKKLLKHLFIPHKSNAYRPHALRHKALSWYSLGLVVSHLAFGASMYTGPVVSDPATVAKNVISYTNQERLKAQKGELYESETLNKAAQQKLADMFAGDYWDHVGPKGQTAWDFIDATGYKYRLAGENLSRGYNRSDDVVTAWMNSPSHRENLLNTRFKEIGVAVGGGKIHGQSTTLMVQLFGDPQIAVAGESTRTPNNGKARIVPEISADIATSPSKAPFWAAWLLIFALVVLDGVMIRKLGLHCSRSHMFNFRVSLLMSVIGLLILMFGFVAVI